MNQAAAHLPASDEFAPAFSRADGTRAYHRHGVWVLVAPDDDMVDVVREEADREKRRASIAREDATRLPESRVHVFQAERAERAAAAYARWLGELVANQPGGAS